VVVGGGAIGARKARALQEAGAAVRWVSPTPPAEEIPDVEVLSEAYRPEHLAGAVIVFACTNDPAQNARIVSDARLAGSLSCAVDQPDEGDFYSPAVVRDGEVVVAVGTGGQAPSLARRLAGKLSEALPESIGDFAACLATIRDELQTRKLPPARRGAILRALAEEESYRVFLEAGAEALRRRVNELPSQGDDACGPSA